MFGCKAVSGDGGDRCNICTPGRKRKGGKRRRRKRRIIEEEEVEEEEEKKQTEEKRNKQTGNVSTVSVVLFGKLPLNVITGLFG